ncbi:glutathione S-transferase T3-like [Triticum dicoccoides]|uniref:glutathione S-transferase T3-like n=1 Tax=Triticum dicoccoides TaxID=85692 RepID=UPI00188FC9F8|nr:glutathione S-transferase T3-like [Triticum dicoccoides]
MPGKKWFPATRVKGRVNIHAQSTTVRGVQIYTSKPRSSAGENETAASSRARLEEESEELAPRSPSPKMEGDQSFLDTIGFGYTQTQPDSPIREQATPSTQHRSAITEKGKSNKGKNWSSDEDKVLIAAWANTSLDIVGTDQNRDAYWDRISEYYNTHKESSWPERNANAINCRYTTINRETSKFCGCLQQILNREESERTIQEKTNDAHILFKEMDLKKKKPFTLMHCYVEFSKYPKWQTREVETSLKKQKKTIDASPGTATNDPADASSVRTDATSIRTDALEHEKRPDGVKRDKRGKADDSACKLSLETVWAAKLEKDEIKEAARNARYAQQLELRKEEIALKKNEDARNEREDAQRQFELDERVMLIDTSGMTDVQKQFYQAKQKEILARGLG